MKGIFKAQLDWEIHDRPQATATSTRPSLYNASSNKDVTMEHAHLVQTSFKQPARASSAPVKGSQ